MADKKYPDYVAEELKSKDKLPELPRKLFVLKGDNGLWQSRVAVYTFAKLPEKYADENKKLSLELRQKKLDEKKKALEEKKE